MTLPVLAGLLAATGLLGCLLAFAIIGTRKGGYEPYSAILFLCGMAVCVVALILTAINAGKIVFGV